MNAFVKVNGALFNLSYSWRKSWLENTSHLTKLATCKNIPKSLNLSVRPRILHAELSEVLSAVAQWFLYIVGSNL